MSAALRRAALVLYGAAKEDREWVLSQLHSPERMVLEQMLAELADIGIPPEPKLLRAALRDCPRNDDPRKRLCEASPAVLAMLLEGEPARLCADVLHLLPVPRRKALMRRLSPARRRELGVQAATQHWPSGAPGPRLAQSLATALAARVPARPAWWRRCLSVLRTAVVRA